MSDSYQNMDYQYVTTTPAERNRVLRNTYWLLALSMVPTVLGAWLGVVTGLSRAMSGGVGLVVFLVGAFGFIYAIQKRCRAHHDRFWWHRRRVLPHGQPVYRDQARLERHG